MTKGTQMLSEEMEKLLDRTVNDFMSTLIDLSGNLMGIEPGTHIVIPQGAGSVKLYKSADSLKLNLWISETIALTSDDT